MITPDLIQSAETETAGSDQRSPQPFGLLVAADKPLQGRRVRQKVSGPLEGDHLAFRGEQIIPERGVLNVRKEKVPKSVEVDGYAQEKALFPSRSMLHGNPELNPRRVERLPPERSSAGSGQLDEKIPGAQESELLNLDGVQRAAACFRRNPGANLGDDTSLLVKIGDTPVTGFADNKEPQRVGKSAALGVSYKLLHQGKLGQEEAVPGNLRQIGLQHFSLKQYAALGRSLRKNACSGIGVVKIDRSNTCGRKREQQVET